MLYGSWFSWDDYDAGQDVAVIAEESAIQMFGTADVVGMTFEMDDGSEIKDMRIVGVKQALEGTFVSTGIGSYLDISVPLTSDSYWATYNDTDSVYIFTESEGKPCKSLMQIKLDTLRSTFCESGPFMRSIAKASWQKEQAARRE